MIKSKREKVIENLYDQIDCCDPGSDKQMDLINAALALERVANEDQKLEIDRDKEEENSKLEAKKTAIEYLRIAVDTVAALLSAATFVFGVKQCTNYQKEDVITNKCFNWLKPKH